MPVRFVQFSGEKRPGSAGAVYPVEDGRTGTEHPMSVQASGAASRANWLDVHQNSSR